jgi:signal-transduction protein with cAMP-binding, CBS, and nucleotidyltransferase domain
MTRERIHHIVIKADGKMEGIVSSLDVIKGLMAEGDEGYIL